MTFFKSEKKENEIKIVRKSIKLDFYKDISIRYTAFSLLLVHDNSFELDWIETIMIVMFYTSAFLQLIIFISKQHHN